MNIKLCLLFRYNSQWTIYYLRISDTSSLNFLLLLTFISISNIHTYNQSDKPAKFNFSLNTKFFSSHFSFLQNDGTSFIAMRLMIVWLNDGNKIKF